jgi:hypothetical protein
MGFKLLVGEERKERKKEKERMKNNKLIIL